MIRNVTRKEAFRVFFLVKGHIDVSEKTAYACYDSYFKRLWYSQEAWTREEAFEKTYSGVVKR